MKEPIKFTTTLFENEDFFVYEIKQITIDHIYKLEASSEDTLDCKKLFIDIALLDKEIISIQDKYIATMKKDLALSDEEFKSFDEQYHVYSVLYNWLEDLILKEKLQQIKNQTIKTKLSTTNLLSVLILQTISSMNKIGQSSEIIYELDISDINDELYRYCYSMQELEYRQKQKKYELDFLKRKAKLLQKESLVREQQKLKFLKHKNKIEKLEESLKDIKSSIKKQENREKEALLTDTDMDELASHSENADCIEDTYNGEYADDDFISSPPPMEEVDIEKLKEQLKSIENELETLNPLDIEIYKKQQQEKLNKIHVTNEKTLQTLRQNLINKCQPIEALIKKNEEQEADFFAQFYTKDVDLIAKWHTNLYMPSRKTTSEGTKKTSSDRNCCVLDRNAENRRKKDLIFRALQYLEAYNIVYKSDLLNDKHVRYTINLEHFKNHPIDNSEVLNRILELLSAYLKFNSTSTVEGFMGHIDWLVNYWMQDPRLFSQVAQTERLILDAFNDKLAISIKSKKKSYGAISDFHLSFDTDMNKVVVFTDKTDIITLKLSDDISVEIVEKKVKSTSTVGTSKGQQFKLHQAKYKIPDKGESRVILMADISHSDFFDIKPLKNQIIYKTELEIKNFLEKNGIEASPPNKIYIEAVDTQDNIIYTVKRSIPHVKILEPTVIKEKFNDIIKSMCDEI